MYRSVVRVSRCLKVSERIPIESLPIRFRSCLVSQCTPLHPRVFPRSCMFSTVVNSQNAKKEGDTDCKGENKEKEKNTSSGTLPTVEEAMDLIHQLQTETEKQTKQIDDLKDKYTRSLAEIENVRRRMNKQIADTKIYGIQSFCKDLLEVADILDRAVVSVPQQTLSDSSCPSDLKNLHEGVIMTRNVLQKTFEKNSLIRMEPEGEKFDPNLHEALFEVPKGNAGNLESGYIAHVAKVGYMLQDRPIRPAQVGVVQK